MGNEMDPIPYLLILWQVVMELALNNADTDMRLREILFCVTC